MKKYISLSLMILLIISCDSIRIEKRRYMKGFYINTSLTQKSKGRFTEQMPDLPKKAYSFIYDSTATQPLLHPSHITYAPTEQEQVKKPEIRKQTTVQINFKKIKRAGNNLHYSKQSHNEFSWAWLFLLCGFTTISFFSINKFHSIRLMKLKSWAHRNKLKARLIMVFTKMLLAFTSFVIGFKLFQSGILFPEQSMTAFTLSYLLAILIYPFKKSSLEKGFSILRKKACELALSVAGLLMFLNFGNNVASENYHGEKHGLIHKLSAEYLESSSEKKHTTEERHFSLLDNTDNGDTITLKVTLSILVVLLSIVLELIIIYFSCILSCSGAEGMAQLLFYGGSAVLIAGCIFAFIGISKIEVKHQETTE
jgi:hypothetical protein